MKVGVFKYETSHELLNIHSKDIIQVVLEYTENLNLSVEINLKICEVSVIQGPWTTI